MSLVAQSDEYLFTPELESLKSALKNASLRSGEIKDAVLIKLPDNNGNEIEFHAWESPVISDEMARAYPDFKTYFISGVQDKNVAGRIFVSRFGVEGMFDQNGKQVKIEPVEMSNSVDHKSFKLESFTGLTCQNNDRIVPKSFGRSITSFSNGSIRRTYDMAIVTTGEFFISSNFGNNNLTTANAAVVNIINLNNVRYNIEMAVQFNIAGMPLIYQDTLNDPFNPRSGDLTGQAANAINASFNINNYDIGHALHATSGGGSGVAGIGVSCNNTFSSGVGPWKARGWSGGVNQNTLAIGIMIHEIGHMLGSPHTFNGNAGSCGSNGQISTNTAFEIGSGNTIMSYAGSCGVQNIQSSSDNYFHSKSLEMFINRINSVGCHNETATGNTPPTVNANPCNGNFTIPKLTPFSLQGSASDPDAGQTITYTWEQIDEDGSGTPTQGFVGTAAGNSALAPLFRSYPPSASGIKRTFPTLNTILNSANVSTFEPLPNVGRTLNFRLTARDNNPTNGGIGSSDLSVTVNGAAGPLTVTSPNTAVSWSPGNQTVTWDVNNTNTIFANVDILLSTDGGISFPITLASGTPNDGNEVIIFGTYPNNINARIKVRHLANSCFEVFDISEAFSISSTCQAGASNICNISPLSIAYGNSSLNLGIKYALGGPITSRSLTTTGSSVSSPFNTSPQNYGNATSCDSYNFGDRIASFRFIPTLSGNFNFSMGANDFLAIYSGTYTSASPCVNYIGGTMFASGSNISYTNQMNINLGNSCGEYTAVLFSPESTTRNITITGPSGAIIYEHKNPIAGYSYTFIARNAVSDIITAQSSISDFTNLTGGTYHIYGVHYLSSLNPSSWVGQTLTSLLSSGQCLAVSSNFKPVTVTCSSPNVTNSGNSGAGTLRDIFSCQSGSSTITYSSGVNSSLTAPLVINKNAIIQGSGNNTIDFNMTNGTGIIINSGTSLTLRNIKVNLAGGASGPVIENHGTLILDNTEITGNTTVNTIIRNNGSGTVTVLNNNVIKKL